MSINRHGVMMWNQIWQQIFQCQISSMWRVQWLQVCLVFFGFGLLGATLPLWLHSVEFPQVPLFGWARSVPRSVDTLLLVVATYAFGAIGLARRETRVNRWGLVLFAVAMLGLMVLDQHRIQPWAYQLVLIAIVLATASDQHACGLMRLLTISIYVHSAISKFDYSFCTGLGRTFLLQSHDLVFGPLPAGAMPWQTGAWPLVFPLGEVVIAAGLVWPRSRRWALWGAAAMHGGLLVILGPWGLGHSWGVLIWNVYFVCQNFALFAKEPQIFVNRAAENPVVNSGTWRAQLAANVLVGWAVLWPCVEPWGVCDVWPAWGLYAQHGEQLNVWVSDRAWEQLPAVWKETAVRNLQTEELSWQLRPQLVSLKLTGAPLYPQNRFQVGVILALAQRMNVESEDISAEWMFPADRWTGGRRSVRLHGIDEIRLAADGCWFNARPRR